MTLLAFHADGDHADVMADTWTYSRGARYLSHTAKVLTLPHLDAAVMVQGSTYFGEAMWTRALWISGEAPDGDAFLERIGEDAAQVYATEADRKQRRLGDGLPSSVVFVVCWSPAAGRFVARGFASDFDWQPMDVHGLHVMPSPLDVRPSDLELHRLDEHFRGHFGDVRPVEQLRHQPRPTAPTDEAGWAALAEKVRQHRTLVDLYSGFKTYVGGDVHLTRLEVGAVTQRRVHRFNDSGDEFRQMMRYSLHPQGQLGPCPCDSGRPQAECCLPQIDHQPCPCGSGSTFASAAGVGAVDSAAVDARNAPGPARERGARPR